MHLEAVYDYKTQGRSDPPHIKQSTLNSQVLHMLPSTFIGANDSHIVLSMNSFEAIFTLSSKAKLGWPP